MVLCSGVLFSVRCVPRSLLSPAEAVTVSCVVCPRHSSHVHSTVVLFRVPSSLLRSKDRILKLFCLTPLVYCFEKVDGVSKEVFMVLVSDYQGFYIIDKKNTHENPSLFSEGFIYS